MIELQVHGDVRAGLTWVLAVSPAGGCDVTSRWEFDTAFASTTWLGGPARLLLEHSHFGRMRGCASDMANALDCQSARLREWSGLRRR